MKKSLAFGINLAVMSFLFCILVSGQNISVDYPEDVECNEEFKVETRLVDFSDDIYDAKIEIKDKNKARISKILNKDEWKSTHYYVNNVIDYPEESMEEFTLKIFQNYEGKASMEIKIRDSSDKVKSFYGYEIEIECNEEKLEDEENSEDAKEERENEGDKEKDEVKVEEERTEAESESLKFAETRAVIRLNEPKDINITGNHNVYKSKTQYIREYGIYGFALFCVFIIIIIIIKNKKW